MKNKQQHYYRIKHLLEDMDKMYPNKELIEFTTGKKFENYIVKFASEKMNKNERVFDFSISKNFKKRILAYLKRKKGSA